MHYTIVYKIGLKNFVGVPQIKEVFCRISGLDDLVGTDVAVPDMLCEYYHLWHAGEGPMQKTEKENQEPAKFYPKGMADEDLLLRVEPVGPGNDEDSFFTILVSLTQTGEKYFNVHGIFEAANLLGGSVYGIPKFPRSIINEGQRPEDLFHRLVKKSYTRQ